jgi:hypothetical protein
MLKACGILYFGVQIVMGLLDFQPQQRINAVDYRGEIILSFNQFQ